MLLPFLLLLMSKGRCLPRNCLVVQVPHGLFQVLGCCPVTGSAVTEQQVVIPFPHKCCCRVSTSSGLCWPSPGLLTDHTHNLLTDHWQRVHCTPGSNLSAWAPLQTDSNRQIAKRTAQNYSVNAPQLSSVAELSQIFLWQAMPAVPRFPSIL